MMMMSAITASCPSVVTVVAASVASGVTPSSTTTTVVPQSVIADNPLLFVGRGDADLHHQQQQQPLHHGTNASSNSSSYLPVEISSTQQSQTLKHFLAQKYAAESSTTASTSDANGDTNDTISTFYNPFSPQTTLVTSSSNGNNNGNSQFNNRLLIDGVLESPIDLHHSSPPTTTDNSVTRTRINHANEQINSGHLFHNHSIGGGVLVITARPPTTVDNFLIKPENVEIDGIVSLPPTPTTVSSSANELVDSTTSNNNANTSINISTAQHPHHFNTNFVSTQHHPHILSSHLNHSPSVHNHHQQLPYELMSPNSEYHHSNSNLIQNQNPMLSSTTTIMDQSTPSPSAITLLPINVSSQSSYNTNDNASHLNLISDSTDNIFQAVEDISSNNNTNGSYNHHHHNEIDLNVNNLLNENVISDLPVLTRAKATLPIDYLYLQEINHQTGEIGVFSSKPIPMRTQFGPVEGIIASLPSATNTNLSLQYSPNNLAYSSKDSLIIFLSDTLILSQMDENHSNWTRFVRPAFTLMEQNLELRRTSSTTTNEIKFYLYATRDISPNEELKVWYSLEYCQMFNIKPLESLNLNGDTSANNNNENKSVESLNNDTVQSTTTTTTGHKLRNKIAKTNRVVVIQQQEQQQSDQQQNGLLLETFQQPKAIKSIPIYQENKTQTAATTTSSTGDDPKPKFQCDKCHKVFPRNYSLRRHLVMHTGEKRYKCPICGSAFNHVYNRNRHVRKHQIDAANSAKSNEVSNNAAAVANTSNEPESSSISVMNNNNNIDSTSSSSSSNNIDSMIDSSDQSKNNKQREQLMKQDDNQSIDSESPSTSTTITAPNSATERMSDSGVVSSSSLEKSPNNKKKDSSNESSTTNGSKELYRCSTCYKKFSTKERLDKHSITHDESARKISCNICSRKFLTQSALSCHSKYHLLSDETRKYECTLCDQTFENIQARREHVPNHINPETGLFHCPKCPKTSEEFSIIRKHLKSFHSEETFQCEKCPKTFPRPDKLRLHMLCHIDHWEFKCNLCNKQFKRKDKLKEHTQRMHAPDRDVRIAAKIAARMQRIKVQRVKKVATKPSQPNYHEFIYKCHLCLLGFKRRGMLVNHLAKRHPEIPYNAVPELNMPIVKTAKDYYCQYCEKVYKSSSKRKAHIIKNHPGKQLPPSNRNKSNGSNSSDYQSMANQSFSQTVGSITIDPHFCNWCHKQYASKAKLMQHQRKKHPDKLSINVGGGGGGGSPQKQKQQNKNFQHPVSTTGTTNMFKFNAIITGDKATIDPISITESLTLPSEATNATNVISTTSTINGGDHLKMDTNSYIAVDDLNTFGLQSTTTTTTPSATNHFDSNFINENTETGTGTGTTGREQTNSILSVHHQEHQINVNHFIDNSTNNNSSIDDFLNIHMDDCPDVNGNGGGHNQTTTNTTNDSDNIITILTYTDPTTGETRSENIEFADIIMGQINGFTTTNTSQQHSNQIQIQQPQIHHQYQLHQHGKIEIINNNNNNNNTMDPHESTTSNGHLLQITSGHIVDGGNSWNQVCGEELAMV